jgi:hypothetical protein
MLLPLVWKDSTSHTGNTLAYISALFEPNITGGQDPEEATDVTCSNQSDMNLR